VAVTERTVTRCYSLSDRPESSHYRITVKRVAPPAQRPELPSGASSSYLHDRVQVGDVLRIKAPAGRFFIDANSDLPVVMVAGGIGVTPMMSMLRWCLAEQSRRTVHLYYGVRRGSEQVFKQTLESLAATHPNFHLNVVQSDPAPDDVPGHDGQHVGRIDVDLLRRTLPHGRHQFYVCGPPAMMASVVPAWCQRWASGASVRRTSTSSRSGPHRCHRSERVRRSMRHPTWVRWRLSMCSFVAPAAR